MFRNHIDISRTTQWGKTDICIPLCSSVTSFLQYTIRTFVRQGEKIDKIRYRRKSAITPLLTWIPLLVRKILSFFFFSIPRAKCFFRTSP